MKKKIKLNDLCFYGDKTSSKYHDSEYIEWDRVIGNMEQNEPVFFTDSCLSMAQMSLFKDAFKIAWLIEPPVIRSDTYQFIQNNHQLFDLVLTHQLDFLPTIPNGSYCIGGMSWVDIKDWGKSEKTKNISIVASDKNYAEGHQLRHKLIKSYDINNRPFDVYGSCTGVFLKDKIDALRDYKFTVVIENCQTNGYFTEKIIDALATYTIPIYWGCKDIGKYYNEEGIVVCETLQDLQDAIKLINLDSQKAYDIGVPFLDENFERAKKHKVIEDWIYENILIPRGLIKN